MKNFTGTGSFPHNPPILDLLKCRPDEVWIIQINPSRIEREPTTVEEIEDRRNELAGNLSLEQEVRSIEMVNAMLGRGEISCDRCRPVRIKRLELKKDLSYASKLDRSPGFLRELIEQGRQQATSFLELMPLQPRELGR